MGFGLAATRDKISQLTETHKQIVTEISPRQLKFFSFRERGDKYFSK